MSGVPPDSRATWLRPSTIAALTLLPLVALVVLIRRYHVDVVYWDQWELVPLIDRYFRGTLSFADLWAQHNEHRPLFPRLGMILLARATGWNLMAEIALNVCMIAGLLPLLWWATRQGREPGDRALASWTWPTVSLLLFSPTQWQNWLWGWQFLAFLQVATSVCGLALLVRHHAGWAAWTSAAVLGIVGSFSFGAGLLYWPVGALALLIQRHPARWQRLGGWLVVAAVVVLAYADGFHASPSMPTPASNFVRVRAFGKLVFYMATFLGAPLAPDDWRLAFVGGGAGTLIFMGLTWRAMARGTLPREDLLPFLLGLTAVATAGMVGLGRAGFGFDQALESRYVTASLWLWVSIVLSLSRSSMARDPGDEPGQPARSRWAERFVVATIVLCLVSMSWPHGRRASHDWHERLTPTEEALLTGTDLEMLQRLYPIPVVVIERRAVLMHRELAMFRPK